MTDIDLPQEVLTWPEINFEFDQGQEKIEHFSFRLKEDCFNSLLDELEFEFKHVSDSLRLLIGHPEFEIVIQKLIIDDRGDRQGFPMKTMSLLLKLSKLHTEKYGHFFKSTDKWYSSILI